MHEVGKKPVILEQLKTICQYKCIKDSDVKYRKDFVSTKMLSMQVAWQQSRTGVAQDNDSPIFVTRGGKI